MKMNKEVVMVKLSDIIPNRFQPRLTFDEEALNELASSIKEHGIIQPLILRDLGSKYEIIAGERRYKASTIAGLTEVPAIVGTMDDQTSAELALIENIQRKDLSAIEEAKSYKKILDMGNFTQEELAKRMGKSQSTIANKMRLLSLTNEVQVALMNNLISERHARCLLQIKDEDLQTAIIVTEPKSGKVIALAGGKDYSTSEYNRAISAKRQVGSTMKPILYYAALENGFTPSTTFTSEKTTFVFSENQTYSPKNYNEKYANKSISMASAIAYSDNIYAVKTHLFLGENTLVDMAKRIGIKTNLARIPSLALGSIEINLLEMATAYNTFANEGYKNDLYFINKVEDMYGNVLYEKKEYSEQVLNKSLVYVLNEMLTNTYSSAFIDYNYPTCINIAGKLSNKYAIKTGTTDTDHLIFGYNKDLLGGIWLGYDDNRKSLVSTSTDLKNMWVDITEGYFKNHETSWYDTPSNVVGVLVDAISGDIATNESEHKKIYQK